jgi:excisionase family DNA binding protein
MEDAMTEPILLRAQEVARLLSISKSSAYDLLASGQIPAVRIGRAVRARRDDVEAFTRRGRDAEPSRAA